MSSDSTKRFSNRVANYIRYRPHYPAEVYAHLRGAIGLVPQTVVADVGAGTGILSRLFLENGHAVIGVEPNKEMRDASVDYLQAFEQYTPMDGTAEATGLASRSVGLIIAGQAFHWFEPRATRVEFERILEPAGHVALIWNSRMMDTTPFLRAYEQVLLTHGIDYTGVSQNHKDYDRDMMAPFFGHQPYQLKSFPNQQYFDLDGVLGRALSSSYSPVKGHPQHRPFVEALRKAFDIHAKAGQITFHYETNVFWGQLGKRKG